MPPLSPQILAYCIGALGILVEWRAYAHQNDQAFRRWSAGGAILWALQYCLLQAWTAGLTMGCTALRTLISGVSQKPAHKHRASIGFISLFALLTGLSWQGAISLLPAFAVINTTLALFYLQQKPLRAALLASSLAWIANDIYWQAWPALLAESVAMLINLYTISKLTAKTKA
jgi:Bacterial inner membrane protein